MAEEEVEIVAAAPVPSDHKRKLEDLEAEAPEPLTADLNENANSESDSGKKAEDEAAVEASADVGGRAEDYDAKRPRLEDKPDGLVVSENGHQEGEKVDEHQGYSELPVEAVNENLPEDAQEPTEEALEIEGAEQSVDNGHQVRDADLNAPQLENLQEQQQSHVEGQEPLSEFTHLEAIPPAEQEPQSSIEAETSRKMEVPNNKVGVLIGKAGDTIRYLQYNSGAKIQITRDAEADPYSSTRPVELIGTLESISKAEKLIKDVIAEADAGGSPALVARGFSTVQAAGAAEQIEIQVPNEKVGLIIGKGGETIKNLQTSSGARIQLIPQHLPEGDQSKERMVRVTGDRKQVEMAREMIKEVMNQPVRPSSQSSGYNQQAFRPHGSAGAQWGGRGPHSAQPMGYDYERGSYPSQNQQYPSPAYGNYPQQQGGAPRGSSGPGWEQRPPATLQGPHQQGGGYDYYGGRGGHMSSGGASAQLSNPFHGHASGHSTATAMGPPHSQGNYNYGQPQGQGYGQQPTFYSQGPAQSYGHGYNETKYENQAPMQSYGGHAGSYSSAYPQGGMHSGYGPQEQYGKPPSYGMPPQGAHYGQPRPNQPGDIPYQGSMQATQSYGPNVPPQQSYPYASSGPMQQTYPPYGSAPAADGYNQSSQTVPAAAGYPQQPGQPVTGYGQPGAQQAAGYAQVGQAGGYATYPSSQSGYPEQPVPSNAGYGYQAPTDPAYAAPPSGQASYVQSAPVQTGYDQSIPQPGGYGTAPAAGYGKSLSPQPGYPQYDSSQAYGAHR